MVEQGPNFAAAQETGEEGESEGFDPERIREIGGFVLRATRRHPKLAICTFAVVAALGVAVGATMPRTYNAQVKMLAQRGSAIRMLTSANPYNLESVDNPTKNVAAMIMRRDNLVSLAREADLGSRFVATRPAALKFKDRLMAAVFGPVSPEDMQQIMAFTLERNLTVTVPDDTTVVISIDWSDPHTAFDLVTLVQRNFLEARYDNDVGLIKESIAVLEEHAKNELAHVDNELAEYQKIVAEKQAVATPAPPAPRGTTIVTVPRPASSAPAAPQVDPDLTKALDQKRAQIRAIEEGQHRTLEGLRQQLLQAQLTLTPMHPTVVALQQQIETVSQPSPDLQRLRVEERSLMAQLVPLTMPPPSASTLLPLHLAVAAADAGALPEAPGVPLTMDRDGRVQLAQSRLASAIRAYEDAMGRIDSAKVELDITRAAYKYRYTVVTPAELPKKPKKATAQSVAAGSIVGALVLAILLAAAADMLAGSILESWQVRRRLKLEVLGELDRPT
jgi:uncharacterized protein involved in exopolysaccharide biosynthesis